MAGPQALGLSHAPARELAREAAALKAASSCAAPRQRVRPNRPSDRPLSHAPTRELAQAAHEAACAAATRQRVARLRLRPARPPDRNPPGHAGLARAVAAVYFDGVARPQDRLHRRSRPIFSVRLRLAFRSPGAPLGLCRPRLESRRRGAIRGCLINFFKKVRDRDAVASASSVYLQLYIVLKRVYVYIHTFSTDT